MRRLHTPHPTALERMNTAELREQFLVANLFVPGQVQLVNTGLDRLIVGSAVPQNTLTLPNPEALRSSFFHERRETGVLNIGCPGTLVADGVSFVLGSMECAYIGRGTREVSFQNGEAGQAEFYLLSCPAHREYPTRRAGISEAESELIGSAEKASGRTIYRYIHQQGMGSCQLTMGFTALDAGSVWNTWPPHVHDRRSEVYLYLTGGGLLLHLLGEPDQSRHLIVRDKQAVLSPSWSMHCGAGESAYRFVWGMAGENQSFEDMDRVDLTALR